MPVPAEARVRKQAGKPALAGPVPAIDHGESRTKDKGRPVGKGVDTPKVTDAIQPQGFYRFTLLPARNVKGNIGPLFFLSKLRILKEELIDFSYLNFAQRARPSCIRKYTSLPRSELFRPDIKRLPHRSSAGGRISHTQYRATSPPEELGFSIAVFRASNQN